MIYNSEFCAKALGITPAAPNTSKEDCFCCRCGRPIKKGDPCNHKKPTQTFTDYPDLVDGVGLVMCEYCDLMSKKSVMTPISGSLVTEDGVYPMRSDANRAWIFLNPPPPPFLLLGKSDKISEHVVWKAPVNYSNKTMLIVIDGTIYEIRHSVLLKAIDACKRLNELILEKHPIPTLSKKTPQYSPFVSLDRNYFSDLAHAKFKPIVLKLCNENTEAQRIVNFLSNCTFGETWALATFIKAKEVIPEKPEALEIKIS